MVIRSVLALLAEILSILAPSALLAMIGFFWFRYDPQYPVKFVTTLVLNVAMPALLFSTLARSDVQLGALLDMSIATLVVHVIFVSLAIVLLKQSKKDWRLAIAHTVGNTGNLGLPVCFLAFGEEGLAYAMVFFSVQCLLLFSLGEVVLAGSASVKRILSTPILYGVLFGALTRIYNLPVPSFVFDATQLLGQLVIPIMLITLGVSLAGMSTKQIPSALYWSAIRTVCAIVIGFGVASMFGFEGVARGVLVIETAAPVAVFNFLMAVKHGRDSTEVSGLILVTHLAAIVYLPMLLGVLL